jgi:glutamine synthetase
MFTSIQEGKKFVAKENIEAIDLKYIDLNGRWRHVTIPVSAFNDQLMVEGVGFDGSSVGFRKTHMSDMALLIPDLSTGMIDPFWERKTLSFICGIVEADTRQPFPLDPRSVAKRAEEYLSQIGWVDWSNWGPEMEFNIFDNISYSIKMNQASYQLVSSEAQFGAEELGTGAKIRPSDGYHAMAPADTLYDLRSEMMTYLEAMGVEIRYHHHEGGGAGQLEIEVPMEELLKTADNVMLIKYVAKMVAQKHGKIVTFMPKPICGDNGSGMHVHQNLWKGNKNLFYAPENYAGLSDLALSYIAGLFEHGPALLAFTNPSTNSYRRLVPGFEAPTHLYFSLGNRTAAVRIPKYATSEEEKRIEFRTPDATSNIYYCLAAQLLAGIDGIEKKLDSQKYGPIDEDVHKWPDEKLKKVKALPTNLGAVLDALKQDYEFLLQGNVFSKELIEAWIEYKINKELIPMQGYPHPYEFALYFDA